MSDRILPSDRVPIPSAQLADLDLVRVQQHITAAQERGRYSGTIDPTDFLIKQYCAIVQNNTFTPTIAGILAFGHEPERWLAGTTGIDVAQFATSEARSTNLTFIEQVRGSLFTVIERTAELLWARSEHEYQVIDAQRVESHAYPRVVLRELTVNTICHRDWSFQGQRIRIHLFPQTLVWTSPGSLPEGVTVANILNAQQHRNPTLANLLFQAGYIESFGLGLDTVYAALHENKNGLPDLQDDTSSFTIRVQARSLHRVFHQVDSPEERQQRICVVLEQRGPTTIVDLAATIGVSRRTLLRDLNDLMNRQRIQTQGATRNLRYALVPDAHSRHEGE